MSDPRRRKGRPTGAGVDGQERILLAARNLFADNGFAGTTLRAVAADAGVDVALIAHHFGNKQGLFVACLRLPDQAHGLLLDALSGPPRSQGRRLTVGYLSLWEDPATGPQVRALARTALTDPAALAQLQATILGLTGRPEVDRLLAGRRTGFFLAIAHLLGVAIVRYVIGIPALAHEELDVLVDRISPVVQRHLSTPDQSPPSTR